MLARMSLADFVQTKGPGLRFDHLDVSGNDGFEFSGRAVTPRRICFSVRSAKKRSAWFIQEAEGPDCRDILGPFAMLVLVQVSSMASTADPQNGPAS